MIPAMLWKVLPFGIHLEALLVMKVLAVLSAFEIVVGFVLDEVISPHFSSGFYVPHPRQELLSLEQIGQTYRIGILVLQSYSL
jgi:hypothetical protein